MGFEYMFFDAALRDDFIAFAQARAVSARHSADAIEGWVVELPEDLAAPLLAELQAEYDAALDRQREWADAQDGDEARDLMGVEVTLPSGQPCLVRLPPALGRRLIEHFSFDEIHALVQTIAANAVDPTPGPLCRRL